MSPIDSENLDDVLVIASDNPLVNARGLAAIAAGDVVATLIDLHA